MKWSQELGTVTLSRFYAIHVLVFPAITLLLMALHLFLVVWHGISAPPEKLRPEEARAADWKFRFKQRYAQLKAQGLSFFPYIIFKDIVAVTLVFLVVAFVAYFRPAELEDLANPTDTTYNPRPEWYFLSVFQLLKYFPGSLEAFAIVLLPLIAFGILFGLPFLDQGPKRHPLQRPFWTGAGVLTIIGLIVLTVLGEKAPLTNPEVKKDPLITAGKRLFGALNCSYCHQLNHHGGNVGPVLDNVGMRRNREWLAGHFRDPQKTSPGTKMPNFKLLDGEVEALVAYMSSLGGGTFTAQAPRLYEDNCATCHKFHGVGEDIGPDLSQIGEARDADYIAAYIKDPVKLNPDAAMQAYSDQLSEDQIKDLANYLYQQGK
jgi:ubiquinol-cytochrome c reductase cytochrome b subunit